MSGRGEGEEQGLEIFFFFFCGQTISLSNLIIVLRVNLPRINVSNIHLGSRLSI